MKHRISIVIFLGLLVTLFGCSKDDDNPTGPGVNSFRIVGTVNGVGNPMSGSVTFTVTNDSTVAGLFRIVEPDTSTHNLIGLYIDTVNVLSASGDGYLFSGYLNDTTGIFRGSVTGTANGLVLGARDDNNSSVAYCGSFTGDNTGNWNFTIEGTTVTGSYMPVDGDGGELVGTINGNTITLFEDGDQVATGTRNGDNVTGTWNSGGGTGTWTGSRCN